MMGERRTGQEALFYEFSLERHVPETHLLQSIDRFVELDGLRQELAPFYSAIGRPSVDTELMNPDADYGLLLWHSLGTALPPAQPSLGCSSVPGSYRDLRPAGARLRLGQIACSKPLGEPRVDRRQQFARFTTKDVVRGSS